MGDQTLTRAIDGPAGLADTVAAPDAVDPAGEPAETFAELPDAHFTIVDEVARGGMGRVMRAFDRRLGRTVAIKLLADDSPSRRARFAREAQITARLQHPGIVPIYEAGTLATGELAYAMKLVSGRELQVAIDRTRELADRLPLVPRILDVAEAIAYAHRRRVIHRDLKPSNIILGDFGETVVIDWGIAKELDAPSVTTDDDAAPLTADLTRPGSVVGTPAYMAPEQAAGEDVGAPADVYALGAILYHALAGRRPYEAKDATSLIALLALGPPPPLDELEPRVPVELAAIVRRAMDRDPQTRYTARELADELRRFTTGQLVAAHRYTLAQRVARWVKRYRAAVIVGSIAFVVLAGLAVGGTWRIIRERDRAEAASIREAARANDLLVTRAEALASTDPTAAIGLLHQLPATATNWRAAGDVLVEAKSRGVPWAFPASKDTTGLALAPDGSVAYSAGDDGVIRKLDLARGTAELIDHIDGARALELAGDELVIATASPELLVRHVTTGATAKLALTSPVDRLVAAGELVAWTDKAHAVWIRRHGQAPTRLPFEATKLGRLALAPDGAHLAIAAPQTAVFDLRGDVPQLVLRHPADSASLAWSADGTRLALATFTELLEVDVTGSAPATRLIRKGMANAAVYIGDDLYFSDAQQVFRVADGVLTELAIQPATYVSVVASRDAALFVTLTGLIGVVGRGGSTTIRAPVRQIYRATADRGTTKVLVATEDHVLCYDAADVIGVALDTRGPGAGVTGFAGNDRFLVSALSGDWKLFDVTTAKPTSLGALGYSPAAWSAPDGSYALAHIGKRRLVLVRPGHPAVDLDASSIGVPVSASQLEVVTETEVTDVTVPALARHTAWRSGAPIRQADSRASHVVATTDHVAWRRLAGHADGDTVDLVDPISTFAIADDGTVYLATGTIVDRWDVGATTVAEHARLGKPIAAMWFYDRVGVVAMDSAGAVWTIASAGAVPERAVAEGLSRMRLAAQAPIAAGFSHDDQLQIYDLETRVSWSVGDGLGSVAIAPDGRHVATPRNELTAIVTIDLPRDRDDYLRRLDAATNLRVGATPNQIVWP